MVIMTLGYRKADPIVTKIVLHLVVLRYGILSRQLKQETALDEFDMSLKEGLFSAPITQLNL